jgi:branched-chain amino acid transport system ATP-binding protein
MSLEVKDVSSGYVKHVDILHNVSIKAEKAKVTTIIGPNGCGKTTLSKTICGFVKPRHGSILCDGEDVTGLKPHELLKRGLAYVFQRRSVFPYLTVQENLELGAWSNGGSKETKKATEEMYKIFPSLERRRKMKAGVLSGGEQRMLEIGRALMAHPKIVLLDEPSAGLAPKVVKEVYEKLEKLKKEKITIILVDQNLRLAVSLADYVYVMELGRIKYEASKTDFETHLSEEIKEWFSF